MPEGDLTARLNLKDIPVGQALSLAPELAQQVEGAFSGAVNLTVPSAKLKDLDAWVASGNVTADRVQAYGFRIDRVSSVVGLSKGTLAVTELRGRLENTPVGGSGELRLKDPYRYQAKLTVEKLDLAALKKLSPKLRPPVSVEGGFTATADLRGTLHPLTVQASGTGARTRCGSAASASPGLTSTGPPRRIA